jgi:hypothetical protein
MDVVDNRVTLVCHRTADRPAPPVPSRAALCRACRAPVWVACDTIAPVARHQRTGQLGKAVVICVPCAKERLDEMTVVVTGDEVGAAAAAAAAELLGMAPGTPVVNLDRVGHA